MSGNKKLIKLPYPFSLEEAMKNNPELKVSDVEILRDWCEKQAHLPKVHDFLLVLFLHSNYYSMEAAKTTAENYYTVKSHIPEVFDNRDPFAKEMRHIFNVTTVFPFPGYTHEGYKVMYCQLVQTDPSLYMFADACKYFFMVGDLVAQRAGTCPGYVFIANAAGLALGHVGRINPVLLKKLLFYIQEAVPVRIKGIHFLHPPPALELIMNMAKPFMKKELMSMFKFHQSVDSMMKTIPPEMVPSDLGGKSSATMGDLHAAEVREMEDQRWWFAEEESCQRVDESKRIGKSKIVNELFGVEGTFKKLEID